MKNKKYKKEKPDWAYVTYDGIRDGLGNKIKKQCKKK